MAGVGRIEREGDGSVLREVARVDVRPIYSMWEVKETPYIYLSLCIWLGTVSSLAEWTNAIQSAVRSNVQSAHGGVPWHDEGDSEIFHDTLPLTLLAVRV